MDLSLGANDNMGMSCASPVYTTEVMFRSHQSHFKVKLAKYIENIGRISFNIFFREYRIVLILGG